MRDQKTSNREAELTATTRIGSGDLLNEAAARRGERMVLRLRIYLDGFICFRRLLPDTGRPRAGIPPNPRSTVNH
jgi:hypothetical protein